MSTHLSLNHAADVFVSFGVDSWDLLRRHVVLLRGSFHLARLCLHLARLRCERNTEEITVRGECEAWTRHGICNLQPSVFEWMKALLADAVQLRADRKELEEETQPARAMMCVMNGRITFDVMQLT